MTGLQDDDDPMANSHMPTQTPLVHITQALFL